MRIREESSLALYRDGFSTIPYATERDDKSAPLGWNPCNYPVTLGRRPASRYSGTRKQSVIVGAAGFKSRELSASKETSREIKSEAICPYKHGPAWRIKTEIPLTMVRYDVGAREGLVRRKRGRGRIEYDYWERGRRSWRASGSPRTYIVSLLCLYVYTYVHADVPSSSLRCTRRNWVARLYLRAGRLQVSRMYMHKRC